MPRVEVHKVIRAPQEYVFGQLADPKGLVRLIKTYTAIRSVRKEGDVEVVEGDVEAMGRKGLATVRRRYFPPERIEEELSMPGIAKASQTITFSTIPEGTVVDFVSDMKLEGAFGKLLGGLAAGRVTKMIDGNFEDAKRILETEVAK